MNIVEKIQLLKSLSYKDQEVHNLYEIVCLCYPRLLDKPREATPDMIKGYNRLVRNNIYNIEMQKVLLIQQKKSLF